jgi:hypothetical protein
MDTFAETAINVYRLLAKENKLPFAVSVCSNKRKFAVFCLQQTNRIAIFR